MKQKQHYIIIAVIISICFWFFDSAVHFMFYDEPEFEWIPTEFNELWMRTTIIVLLLSMGFYAHLSTQKLLRIEHEKLQLEHQLNEALRNELELHKVQEEQTRETVLRMHDIINNFLNNLQIFRIEAENSNLLSKESQHLFDELIHQAAANVREIGEDAMSRSSKPSKPS